MSGFFCSEISRCNKLISENKTQNCSNIYSKQLRVIKELSYVMWHLPVSLSGDSPTKTFQLGNLHIGLFISKYCRALYNSHCLYTMTFIAYHASDVQYIVLRRKKRSSISQSAATSSKQPARHRNCSRKLPKFWNRKSS
jgi:hypothetical protein